MVRWQTQPFSLLQSANTNSSTVVGVDFGTLNTVIAVARNRGVDVVRRGPSLFYGMLKY